MSLPNSFACEILFTDKSTMTVFYNKIRKSKVSNKCVVFEGVESSIIINVDNVVYMEERALTNANREV